mmetsp:Transcript_65734/g.129524  ORF Transcript_65734/g.129524 Transcript_65734/m.129524 type:complete len:261 (-) Transcript_65734:168-950(-)
MLLPQCLTSWDCLGIFSTLDVSFVDGFDACFGADAAGAVADFVVGVFSAFCFFALVEPRSFSTLVFSGACRPLRATCSEAIRCAIMSLTLAASSLSALAMFVVMFCPAASIRAWPSAFADLTYAASAFMRDTTSALDCVLFVTVPLLLLALPGATSLASLFSMISLRYVFAWSTTVDMSPTRRLRTSALSSNESSAERCAFRTNTSRWRFALRSNRPATSSCVLTFERDSASGPAHAFEWSAAAAASSSFCEEFTTASRS